MARVGYCEYNCTLCGQVCPTGAIRRLALTIALLGAIGAFAALTRPSAEAIDALLSQMLARNASDLHLSTSHIPCFRIDGDVVPVPGAEPPSVQRLTSMIYSLMPQRNRKEFERRNDTDFAHEIPASRFRVNVFRDRVGIGAVIRQIPNKIRSVEELGVGRALALDVPLVEQIDRSDLIRFVEVHELGEQALVVGVDRGEP